jgi:hypothetical protein
MEKKFKRMARTAGGRFAWKLQSWFYYVPRYLLMFLGSIRPSLPFRMLSTAMRALVTGKKRKDLLFGRQRVQLHYLFACDKYNFMWNRMPYCVTHHYRIDPRDGKVVKMCGCFVLPFRSYAESCNTMG